MSTPCRRRGLNIALAAGAVVFVAVSLIHPPDVELGLAYLSPAMFVFLLLGLGRYPGQRRLTRLLERSWPARRRGRTGVPPPPRQAGTEMPRGGALLGAALAGRAPPLSCSFDATFSTA